MPLSDHIKPEAARPPTREEIERARMMYAEKLTSGILATDMSLRGRRASAQANAATPPAPDGA